jgi:hypothetical protein
VDTPLHPQSLLPPSGFSLSFYSPCPAKPEPQKRLQNKPKRKNKSMFTDKEKTNSPNKGPAVPPSNADIAIKAYEIWLARGQETGNDQQHWFEAKRRLQLV